MKGAFWKMELQKNITEQNRRYVIKEIGQTPVRDLRIKGLVEQEWGPQQPTTKKLARMHEEAQKILLD